jgi:hypothetical protein
MWIRGTPTCPQGNDASEVSIELLAEWGDEATTADSCVLAVVGGGLIVDRRRLDYNGPGDKSGRPLFNGVSSFFEFHATGTALIPNQVWTRI